ncbi:MAG: DNA translocase FtsK [Candidatus Nomurabacteria bacterium]|jgi:S-DNA-T family DNA segregation ATPase FtsK/SpoIIIE|nr:DNA translocase FtsK [Candidatus Nomurabacteria bacterium]
MSKKRGPGRPPKGKGAKESKVAEKAKHSVPHGFWSQVGAILLILIAAVIGVGLFETGGIFPIELATVTRWLIGWTAFLVPLVFIWQAIQIFRHDEHKMPGMIGGAVILFIASIAGLVQLSLDDPTLQAESAKGNGGGMLGWVIAKAMLDFLNKPVSILILCVLVFILTFYVFRISPKSVVVSIINFFKREDPAVEGNIKVAKEMAKVESSAVAPSAAGEFTVNKGVPIVEKEAVRGHDKHVEQALKQPEVEKTALTMASDPNWEFPPLELLEKKERPADPGDIQQNQAIIRDTLSEFNINVEMKSANVGPKVTQYTLKPPSGVKLSRITALDSSLALNLAAPTLRIEAPIPGEKLVGIEVPNAKAADVRLHSLLNSGDWKKNNEPLAFTIGKDISGRPIISELNKMPHVVIAGQTGSGKSVMINSLLCSLLYRNSPADMKLILVDPKQVEMTPYSDIPHLLTPVITDPEKTISALKWAVGEMERRYTELSEERVRDIKSYNQKMRDRDEGETMPYIVIVIDEMADLMMIAKRDVEALIVRIAQKARAVGIHLVLATQRPSVDVITGLIKANVPARIAFTVASQVDSRTILDQAGAEKLLGQGDMLMITPSMSKPKRVQGAFLSDDEVLKITDYLRMAAPPNYNEDIIAQQVQIGNNGGIVMDMDGGSGDGEYKDAVRVVIEARKASTSLLQRRLRIGYGKAARIMEEMEENGVIGPQDGSRPREVLISSIEDLGE